MASDEPGAVHDKIDERLRVLDQIASRFDPYEDEKIELSDSERLELQSVALDEIMREAIADRSLVDYETISAILRHPAILEQLTSDAREKVAVILLQNSEQLYPVAEEVGRFLQTFANASPRQRKRIGNGILRSIERRRGEWPPDFYMIWMMSVFLSSPNWGGAGKLLQIFRTHPSDSVRRFAALALQSVGGRSEAVAVKGEWQRASPMTRLAILLASRKLGSDERRHWRTTLGLIGVIEKLI
jgi:hypothetical protein